jgi:Domain of unknown function (DUF4126)
VTSWIWAIGRLGGLSISAGVRASMTLLIMGVLSREGWGFHLAPGFLWLESSIAIGVLVLLAIFEIAFDKVPSFDRLYARLSVPWHIAAGAIAGAAAVSHGVIGLIVGLVAGAGLAMLGSNAKRLWRPRSTTSTVTMPLLSLVEDLTASGAAVLSATLPPIGYAVVAWTAWFDVRLRRRRVAKYKGLRVLSR